MKLIQVQDLFEIYKPKTLTFNSMIPDEHGINFVSSRATNNGCNGKVKIKEGIQIYPAGAISVPLKGSVFEASLQLEPFYCAHQTAVLVAKQPLTTRQKLYYILCFKQLKQKFSYGRQGDRTISTLEIPAPEEIPPWVETIELPQQYTGKAKSDEKVELPPVSEWKEFKYTDLFDLEKGRGPSAADAKHKPGNTPYIGASAENNGITIYSGHAPEHQGNVVTIATDGSVGEAFYQPKDFNATSNIMVLHLKCHEWNPQIGLFISTIIRQEQNKFSYGRKWGLSRMKESFISLPVTSKGQPDYDLMERYINSLPYSDCL